MCTSGEDSELWDTFANHTSVSAKIIMVRDQATSGLIFYGRSSLARDYPMMLLISSILYFLKKMSVFSRLQTTDGSRIMKNNFSKNEI